MKTTSTRAIVLLTVAGMLALSRGAPVAMDRGDEARYSDIQRRHQAEILKMPGVIGAGVGLSQTAPDRPVIRLFVRPGTSQAVKDGLPKEIEGAPVEVIEQEPKVLQ
jgi:hypothetical protein